MDLETLNLIKESYLNFIQTLKEAPNRMARDLGYTAIPEMKQKWLDMWQRKYDEIEREILISVEREKLNNLIEGYEKKLDIEENEENKIVISDTLQALNTLRNNNG